MKRRTIKNIEVSNSHQVALIWSALFVLLAASRLPSGQAFCNCLGSPMSMFGKSSKPGLSPFASPLASSVYGPQVGHPGERASWYPQSQQQQQLSAYPASYGQQGSIKRFNLFQPKWRTSLFGPKKWMMDWRMMGSNANFFRPGYGYNWPQSAVQISNLPQAQFLSPSSYQYGDQTQQQYSSLTPYVPTGSSYSPQLNTHDGWTALPSANNQLPPYNSQQQQPVSYGDSFGLLPPSSANLIQPGKQQSSPTSYGTKGASGSGSKQPYSSTTKNSRH